MDSLKAKENFFRVCQLLVDKGVEAFRAAFNVIHPPSTLAAVLNANKSVFRKLRYNVITQPQWNLLFPASGTPDVENFDITLLAILLKNICGLCPPLTGWNTMPLAADTSMGANIVRIKLLRNHVYHHTASCQLDDSTFEKLWQEISKPLVNLGIPQHDIDEMKVAPLNPEEEAYIENLKEWKKSNDDIFSNLSNIKKILVQIRGSFEGTVCHRIY